MTELLCFVFLKCFPAKVHVVDEVERRCKGRGIGTAGWVMGQLVRVKRDEGRCGERRGCGGEKKVVGKAPKASEVVDGERDEDDDSLVVETGDDLGPVRGLGA
jgi:hypothetical protein